MDDAQRLKSLLASGALLHPISDAANLVDFAAALHNLIGARGAPIGTNATAVKALIGEPEHLVFALIDGFGMNFVEAMPRGAFVRDNLALEMRSVFPSTTSAALTTLATGEWPARHAVTGWHVLLPQLNAVSVIIGFQRTPDKTPLSRLGVSARDAYPVPSRMSAAKRAAAYLMPKHITNTAYSTYWAGGSRQLAYRSSAQAVNAVMRHIAGAKRPTFTYLYMPQVDSAAHKHGAFHRITMNEARKADETLERLANALPSNARLVMTADHGHLDAPNSKTYAIAADDEMLKLCETKPSGDVRLMYATVRPENRDAFRRAVSQRLGGDFLTLDMADVEAMRLLGPEPRSPETRRRTGNTLTLSVNNAVIDLRKALGEDSRKRMRSHHSGLTPAEMRIPLVIA